MSLYPLGPDALEEQGGSLPTLQAAAHSTDPLAGDTHCLHGSHTQAVALEAGGWTQPSPSALLQALPRATLT